MYSASEFTNKSRNFQSDVDFDWEYVLNDFCDVFDDVKHTINIIAAPNRPIHDNCHQKQQREKSYDLNILKISI